MTKTHYTRQELFILRNHIPVDRLIKKLGIPAKMCEEYFRFCCPVCREFDTDVNPKTNLARCFRCEKNYNTIDLVMLVKRSDFIHSVKFLKTIYEKKIIPVTTPLSIKKAATGQPVSIGNILKAMEPALKGPTTTLQTEKSKLTIEMLHVRVSQLEQQVNHLTQKIKVLEGNH